MEGMGANKSRLMLWIIWEGIKNETWVIAHPCHAEPQHRDDKWLYLSRCGGNILQVVVNSSAAQQGGKIIQVTQWKALFSDVPIEIYLILTIADDTKC